MLLQFVQGTNFFRVLSFKGQMGNFSGAGSSGQAVLNMGCIPLRNLKTS